MKFTVEVQLITFAWLGLFVAALSSEESNVSPAGSRRQGRQQVGPGAVGNPAISLPNFNWKQFVEAQAEQPGTKTLAFGNPDNPHTAVLDPPDESYL
jgi:hypothetical protein